MALLPHPASSFLLARPRPARRHQAASTPRWPRASASSTTAPNAAPPRGHPASAAWSRRAGEPGEDRGGRGRRSTSAPRPLVILVRMRPDEIMAQQGKNWDYDGHLCYSKICTHVGCPAALYEQKTHHMLCPCHQSTFDLADGGKRRVRTGRPAAAPARDRRRRGGILGRAQATSPSPSARASGSADDAARRTAPQRDGRPLATPIGDGAAGYLDDRIGVAKFLKKHLQQGLPRPLVVHARRDRALQLHHAAADRHVPVAVLQAVDGRGRLPRLVRPAQRHPDVRGLRLDAAHQLRRPRRSADAADPPLGGAAVRRRR